MPAVALDGWLLTHAGVHPCLADEYGLPAEPMACTEAIRDLFARRLASGAREPLFDAVGRDRGGAHPSGGIFWCDWRRLSGGLRERLGAVVAVGNDADLHRVMLA